MRILFISTILHLVLSFSTQETYSEVLEDVVSFNIPENSDVIATVNKESNEYSRYENMLVLIPRNGKLQGLSPVLRNDFLGFKEAIGFRESSGKYNCVNKYGYLGKYQFGDAALEELGIYNKEKFLNSPEFQERAFIALCSLNKYKLRNYIGLYNGKTINGVKLTESGMLAAAHLLGPGAVIDFIKSNGQNASVDGMGTSVVEYLKNFNSYDVSVISSSKRIRLKMS